MSAAINVIVPTQGASAKLLDNRMFNRLVALAFDVPKGEKGDKGIQGEQGLFGEVGNAGETGVTGTDGVFGTLVQNGSGALTGIAPDVITEAFYLLFAGTSQLWMDGGANAKRNLQRNRGLPGPHSTNTSNRGDIFNNLEFYEIIDPKDGITKYIPGYWRET